MPCINGTATCVLTCKTGSKTYHGPDPITHMIGLASLNPSYAKLLEGLSGMS
jgi:hypothetical protein